jgi:integral membrane protein
MSQEKAEKNFMYLAYTEAISLIILVFIAVPLKRIWGMPEAVSVVGMAHGVLFLAYLVVVVYLKSEYSWSLKRMAFSLLASIIPFGPWLFKKQISH